MATLTPRLTTTPGGPSPSYSVGIAETFSWVPIDNDAGRPLFARATYITNASDLSISLSAAELNVQTQEKSAATSSQTGPLTASGTALGANAARKNFFIQNVGTTPLYVALGSAASSSNFAVILGAGMSAGDGTGAAYESNLWTGLVSVSGTHPLYTVWEMV